MYVKPKTRVYSIVVTYYPEASVLRALLASLTRQTARTIVVDNTPFADKTTATLLDTLSATDIRLIRLGKNKGIAHALNVGIKSALRGGATHVLLSDQDSLPALDMVATLLKAEARLAADGSSIGAIGPTFTDRTSGLTFPFQTLIPGDFFYSHALPTSDNPYVEALTLITSGTLIPASVINNVGFMREDFFIDHVDAEWCLRARARGYKLFGVGGATMYHRLGDASLRVWYMGWRTESAYSPTRVYYRVRNFVALCKAGYVPTGVKLRSSWYTLGMIYTQCVFGRFKLQAFRLAMLGLWHGVIGRMGAYP